MWIQILCLTCLAFNAAPSSADSNILDDVLKAVHKVLDFFQSDSKDINLDGLFGIRVAQGQLTDVLQNLMTGALSLPLPLRMEVVSLVTQMELISRRVIRNLDDTDYYTDFAPVVDLPWNASYKIRHVASDVPQIDPEELKMKVHNYDEPRGDRCFEELFGSITDPMTGRPISKCTIRPSCQSFMLEGETNGYHLTHQLLYLSYGMQNCTKEIEYVTGQSIEFLLAERCTRAYGEAVTLFKSGIPHKFRDYFMEDLTVCGMIGFQEFFQPEWLQLVLSFQSPSGCFAEKHGSDDQQNRKYSEFGSRGGMRKLLVESVMRGHCLSHASGLGVSTLGTYLRFLLENLDISSQ